MSANRITSLKSTLREVRSALWFRPASACLMAALAALLIAAVDSRLPHDTFAFLPRVDAQLLRELLRLAAGSMLTVATVTLSVLMLVLSIAAGQASPRAVPELMADPVTQNALGTFLATFVFAVAALLLFGFEAILGPGVTLVFLTMLALIVLALKYLVQWIHHVADALKVNRVIQRVFEQAQRVLEDYLEQGGERRGEAAEPPRADNPLACASTGYVQLVDTGSLDELAAEHDLHVRMCVQEGDFVHPPLPLLRVSGGEPPRELAAALVGCVAMGAERSSEGDPRLGFELLAEIGCRALSPGINDPQTAITCTGYLGALLARAAALAPGEYPPLTSPGGRVQLLHPDFDALLERAYRPMVRDGAGCAEVLFAILDALCDLAQCAHPHYLAAIAAEGERALAFGSERLALERDRRDLRVAFRRLRDVAARRGAAARVARPG